MVQCSNSCHPSACRERAKFSEKTPNFSPSDTKAGRLSTFKSQHSDNSIHFVDPYPYSNAQNDKKEPLLQRALSDLPERHPPSFVDQAMPPWPADLISSRPPFTTTGRHPRKRQGVRAKDLLTAKCRDVDSSTSSKHCHAQARNWAALDVAPSSSCLRVNNRDIVIQGCCCSCHPPGPACSTSVEQTLAQRLLLAEELLQRRESEFQDELSHRQEALRRLHQQLLDKRTFKSLSFDPLHTNLSRSQPRSTPLLHHPPRSSSGPGGSERERHAAQIQTDTGGFLRYLPKMLRTLLSRGGGDPRDGCENDGGNRWHIDTGIREQNDAGARCSCIPVGVPSHGAFDFYNLADKHSLLCQKRQFEMAARAAAATVCLYESSNPNSTQNLELEPDSTAGLELELGLGSGLGSSLPVLGRGVAFATADSGGRPATIDVRGQVVVAACPAERLGSEALTAMLGVNCERGCNHRSGLDSALGSTLGLTLGLTPGQASADEPIATEEKLDDGRAANLASELQGAAQEKCFDRFRIPFFGWVRNGGRWPDTAPNECSSPTEDTAVDVLKKPSAADASKTTSMQKRHIEKAKNAIAVGKARRKVRQWRAEIKNRHVDRSNLSAWNKMKDEMMKTQDMPKSRSKLMHEKHITRLKLSVEKRRIVRQAEERAQFWRNFVKYC